MMLLVSISFRKQSSVCFCFKINVICKKEFSTSITPLKISMIKIVLINSLKNSKNFYLGKNNKLESPMSCDFVHHTGR